MDVIELKRKIHSTLIRTYIGEAMVIHLSKFLCLITYPAQISFAKFHKILKSRIRQIEATR